MRQRKLRFAKWELERMTIRDLQRVWETLQAVVPTTTTTTSYSRKRNHRTTTSSTLTFVEKSDLIQAILSSPRVDVIHTPEPVSYYWHDLQTMSISKLKLAMQEAGVFFDPKDVVEKQDMLQIFKNSGRLILLLQHQEEEEEEQVVAEEMQRATTASTTTLYDDMDHSASAPPRGRSFLVETVDSDDEDTNIQSPANANDGRDDSIGGSMFMEPIHYIPPPAPQPQQKEEECQSLPPNLPDDVLAPSDVIDDLPSAATLNDDKDDNRNDEINRAITSNDNPTAADEEHVGQLLDDADDEDHRHDGTMNPENNSEDIPNAANDEQFGQFDDADEDVSMFVNHSNPTNDDAAISNDHRSPTPTRHNYNDTLLVLEDRSIAELQLLANFMNVPIDRCLEKADIMDRLRENPTPFREAMSHWSVSVLSALARLVEMDVSNLLFTNNHDTTCQEDLVLALLEEARQRHHLAPYLNALIPLARLSVSELKDVARERGIDISGCLEVEDMIRKLATATPETAGSWRS
jgi:hypothetical protein